MGAKKNLVYLMLVSVILLVGVIYSPPFAYADDDEDDDDDDRDEIICENITLRGIITDNIRVPEDSRCLLKAFVQGDIFLEDNSLLDAYDSTIEGNIAGPETAILLLNDSTLKGDIHVDGDIGIDGVGFDSLSVVGNIKSKGSECVIIIDAVIKGNGNHHHDKAKIDLKKKSFVIISNTIIDGNVKIKETDTDFVICEGGPLELGVELVENNISGNVDVKKGSNKNVLITSNSIGRHLDVEKNKADSITVKSNEVGWRLDVDDNKSDSITVESNVVKHYKLDVEDNTSDSITVELNEAGRYLDVEDNVVSEDTEEFKLIVGFNKVGKNMKVRDNNNILVDKNTVDRDLKVDKNKVVSVTNNSIGDDLNIKKNKDCTHSNNKVADKSRIRDCREI